MNTTLRSTVRVLLGRAKAGRGLTVYPDDVFLTSYPKSGNTWIRFLIANLVWTDGSTDFTNLDKRVAPIYGYSDRQLLALPRPRLLKSHEYFDPRYPKVLYIVRDVRSVIVSYYCHLLRRGKVSSEETIYAFAELFLAGKLDAYGSWRDNVVSWLRLRSDNDKFLCIRYEDLSANPTETVRKLAAFLNMEYDADRIELAIKRSSFGNMKTLAEQAGSTWRGNRGVKNPEIPFVRSGKTNEWSEKLDSNVLELIYRECGDLLSELGYPV
jgi:hypothetical protein